MVFDTASDDLTERIHQALISQMAAGLASSNADLKSTDASFKQLYVLGFGSQSIAVLGEIAIEAALTIKNNPI